MHTHHTMLYDYLPSPIGRLLLVAVPEGLSAIYFERGQPEPEPGWRHDPAALAPAAQQLREYFAGRRTDFDVPLALVGTPFQRRVWDAVRAVPYGATVTYGELAARLGRPGAARAVGAANGRNPVPIIVPCHRVVGSDGSLTGYGGGIEVKQRLLELEGVRAK